MFQIKDIANKLLKVSVLSIMVILCMRDILGMGISGIMIVGIISMFMLILPYAQLVYLLFFILPLTCGIPGYVMLVSIVLLVLKSKHITAAQIIPALLIAISEILHVTFYDFNADFRGVLSYLSFISVFFFLLFEQDKTVMRQVCIKYFCFGAVFTLAVIYAGLMLENGFAEVIAGNLRSGFAMGIEEVEEMKNRLVLNANSIAYYSIVSLACLMLGRKKLLLGKFVYIALLFITIAGGVLSFSRTWLLLVAVVFVLFIIANKPSNKFVLGAAIAAIVGLVIVSDSAFFAPIVENMTSRIGNDDIATAGGRFIIFERYNDFWLSEMKYVLFGTGAVYYKEVAGQFMSIHNGIQQIYVCYGLCGILLYIGVIVGFLRRNKHIKLSLLFCLPIIACFLFNQSIQFLNPYYLMLPFIPAAYALRIEKRGA